MKSNPALQSYCLILKLAEERIFNPKTKARVERIRVDQRQTFQEGNQDNIPSDAVLMSWLKEAKIIVLDADQYLDLKNQVMFSVIEKCGHPAVNDPSVLLGDEGDIVYDKVTAWGRQFPFPSPLPFPLTLILFANSLNSPGVYLSKTELHTRFTAQVCENIQEVVQLGVLIHQNGTVCEILLIERGKDYGIAFGWMRKPGEDWSGILSFMPWILQAIFDGINESRGFIIEKTGDSFGERFHARKEIKKSGIKGVVPPIFYTIHLKQTVEQRVSQSVGDPPREILWSHRWDVRSHERIRVLRGDLPLDDRYKEGLRRRGYRVFDTESLDNKDLERLFVRSIPPKTDKEWLAILITEVSSHLKGPEDLPYVPAIRELLSNVRQ